MMGKLEAIEYWATYGCLHEPEMTEQDLKFVPTKSHNLQSIQRTDFTDTVKLVCNWICSAECGTPTGMPAYVFFDYVNDKSNNRAKLEAVLQSAIAQVKLRHADDNFMIGDTIYTKCKNHKNTIQQTAINNLLAIAEALHSSDKPDTLLVAKIFTADAANLFDTASAIGWTVNEILNLFGMCVPPISESTTFIGKPFFIYNNELGFTFDKNDNPIFTRADDMIAEFHRDKLHSMYLRQ